MKPRNAGYFHVDAVEKPFSNPISNKKMAQV
jgi:hypothetical protein